MTMRTGLKQPAAGRGFTLVELLLALVLLLLLLGAVVFSFSTLERGAALEEGVTQLEGLLRFARAHAANTGRQVEVCFEEDFAAEPAASAGSIRVLWEPDPLGQPGYFEELPTAGSFVAGIAELVQVQDVRLLEPAGTMSPTSTQKPDAALEEFFEDEWSLTLPSVVFYPDGSSDPAEIVLTARSAEDLRRVAVRVDGFTGALRREWLAAEEPAEEEAVGRPAATTPSASGPSRAPAPKAGMVPAAAAAAGPATEQP
jgi:prepilin-type N-terminal cleavage/methylation domain-containing protein